MPIIVGQVVPTDGSSGCSAIAVSVAVGTGHRQSVSERQLVFLHDPEVDPLGI